MKSQSSPKPMDEREKLRRFRELDDAFAEALRSLDNPSKAAEIPTGPPVRTIDSVEEEERRQREEDFERRLHALIQEYAQSPETVAELVTLLQSMGRVA
ncbi:MULTISPECIES: hypothetical protein [Halomonas]|uniref:hypothetical protein n=1 Tax=Halomonas TaxID=2745 RepID=UPI001C95BDBD|nr:MULTISPECIES: hypothetical protein [Halomonas]MBY6030352.1 hypothetical protein [Halomonas sp. DP8Y7-1]MBY6208275.1 hypothetical protein [Halomonas sp. DP3Y7-2]MBY6229084.1 hypothetical protein [Halomonas sp. DP3Y7-1]MCA0916933.1 hypothetical protein [Halomonas denitrificans]